MFNSSYRITRVWGIPIKVHISLIVLLILFALPSIISGNILELSQGLFLALCLFTSIVLHELGHSFVAIKKGCHVREITLLFIGGAAQMEQIPTRPKDEILMALAGPFVSIVIGLICILTGFYFPLPNYLWPLPLTSKLLSCNYVEYLGVMNFWLAAFNLLPSFPMDGGRVVRALLARRKGRLKATYIAAKLGKIMAIVFVLIGFKLNDWMLPVIAFFIYTAAGQEYRMVQIQEAAKTYGFGGGGWSPFGTFWGTQNQDEPEDKVIISPPSYRDGPDSEADLRTFRKKNPFSDLFGQ